MKNILWAAMGLAACSVALAKLPPRPTGTLPPRPTVVPTATQVKAGNCEPPYYLEGGIRKIKPECLK